LSEDGNSFLSKSIEERGRGGGIERGVRDKHDKSLLSRGRQVVRKIFAWLRNLVTGKEVYNQKKSEAGDSLGLGEGGERF